VCVCVCSSRKWRVKRGGVERWASALLAFLGFSLSSSRTRLSLSPLCAMTEAKRGRAGGASSGALVLKKARAEDEAGAVVARTTKEV